MNRLKALFAVIAVTAVTLFAGPTPQASADIGAWHWARSTIYVYHATPNSPFEPYMTNREQYWKDMSAGLGVHWRIVDGLCQKYYPCIRLEERSLGDNGDSGLTIWPKGCGNADDPNVWCNWTGTGADGTYAIVTYNTFYPNTNHDAYMIGCHELGHGLADLQHSSDYSCMHFEIYAEGNIRISNAEADEVRLRFIWIPLDYSGNFASPSTQLGNGPITSKGPGRSELLRRVG